MVAGGPESVGVRYLESFEHHRCAAGLEMDADCRAVDGVLHYNITIFLHYNIALQYF